MNIKKWMADDVFVDRAEGDIIVAGLRYPYITELCGPGGSSVVIWKSDNPAEHLRAALDELSRHRDIVRAYWSDGEPTSYWAHQDVGVTRI